MYVADHYLISPVSSVVNLPGNVICKHCAGNIWCKLNSASCTVNSSYIPYSSLASDMARMRNDSFNNQSHNTSSVDVHRRQIGKQDRRKNEPIIRRSKSRVEQKENAPAVYKDSLLMVVAVVFLVMVAYLILYLVLADKPSLEQDEM